MDSAKKLAKMRTFQNDLAQLRSPQSRGDRAVVPADTKPSSSKFKNATIYRPPQKTSGAITPSLKTLPGTAPQTLPPVIRTAPTLSKITSPDEVSTEKPLVTQVKPVLARVIPNVQSGREEPVAGKPLETQSLAAAVKNISSKPDETLPIMDQGVEVGSGSIVTDKKLKHFGMLSSMWETAKYWVNNEKERYEEKIEEKRRAIPTVRTIENRKKVVEQAAQGSALAPKDDYRKLTKKLPTIQKEEAPAPAVVIKEKSAVKAPSWSHYEGEEKPIATPSAPAEPPVTPPAIQKRPPVIPVFKIAETKEAPTANTASESVSPTLPKPAETPALKSAPASEPKSVTKPPAVKVVGQKSNRPYLWSGRALFYLGGVATVLIAIGAGTGATWLFLARDKAAPNTNPVAVTLSAPQRLVRYDELKYAPLTRQKSDLWNSVRTAEAKPSTDLLVIVPAIEDSPAGVTDILSVIDLHADGAFLRNITAIDMGRYRNIPFMVMAVSSFDTAFGGILAAEDNLATDLDLFPASTAASSTDIFIDETIKNHDVRVLKNGIGEERLVYGFVNRNIIVITQNGETFDAIADLVR